MIVSVCEYVREAEEQMLNFKRRTTYDTREIE